MTRLSPLAPVFVPASEARLVSLENVPKVILVKIGSFLSLNISKELTKKVPWTKYNTEIIGNRRIISLDTAHALTEQLYGMLALSKVSKYLNACLKAEQAPIIEKVGKIMSKLQDEQNGAQAVRYCVDSGCYLKVLRVFFFYKPAALFNYAGDPRRQEAQRSTILHNATLARPMCISTRFVQFILQMDQTYKLGLTNYRDFYGRMPRRILFKSHF